jgi:hypothetical protein
MDGKKDAEGGSLLYAVVMLLMFEVESENCWDVGVVVLACLMNLSHKAVNSDKANDSSFVETILVLTGVHAGVGGGWKMNYQLAKWFTYTVCHVFRRSTRISKGLDDFDWSLRRLCQEKIFLFTVRVILIGRSEGLF